MLMYSGSHCLVSFFITVMIRAIIAVVNPQIGERIYDGACGSAGLSGIALPDVMIATVAIEQGLLLWTLDRHFKNFARKTELTLY